MKVEEEKNLCRPWFVSITLHGQRPLQGHSLQGTDEPVDRREMNCES